MPLSINSNPLVLSFKYGSPSEFTSYVKSNYELKPLTYPFKINKGIVSSLRCHKSGFWTSNTDGSISRIQLIKY